jgi:hypothetical protein
MDKGTIGIIIGSLLTGTAMIFNSYFSTKFSSDRLAREKKRERNEKESDEIQKFYENILHLSDKLIRNEGMATPVELEDFYKQEIKLKLISTKEIFLKFCELKKEIGSFAEKLPKMPEEFIPKFEDDYARQNRMSERKKAKEKREKEANQYRPNLYIKHSELADLIQLHVKEMKEKI